MEKRTGFILALVLTALLCSLTAARAQDDDDMVVSNLSELAQQAFSPNHCLVLPWFTPWQYRGFSLDGGEPWWVDCSQVPCTNLPPASNNVSTNAPTYGITLMPVQLTLDILTGETTLQPDGSTNVVAVIAPPSDYQPGAQPEGGPVWYWWQQATNCPDCWGIVGAFPPPTLSVFAYLADINDYATYEANLAAQEAQAEAAQAASAASTSGSFMPMDDDDGGGDPCSMTNLTQPFYITGITQGTNGTTITWQSCPPVFRYLVFTASQMTTNTAWAAQSYASYIWGQSNTTSWTDMSTTNANSVTQRFYRVQRLLGSPIAAGGNHSVALRPDGTLWTWGSNGDGQLSDGVDIGQETSRPYPGEVAYPTSCTGQMITNAVAVAGGGAEFTIVADANGTVWASGGQPYCGDGSDYWPATPVGGVSNVVSVAAGDDHVLALCTNGTVWAWGSDGILDHDVCTPVGQLGVGGLSSPYPIFPGFASQVNVSDTYWSRVNKGFGRC